MAGELQFNGPATGATCYCLIRDRIGRIWSTSGGTGGFDTYGVAGYDYGDYAIDATEQGSSNYYTADVPAAVPAGVYAISAHQQTGASPAQTDRAVGAGDLQWNGTVTLPLSDLATSGQLGLVAPVRLARGVAISGFPLYLKSAADHVTPFTSGVVSGQISRDGGSFGALQSGVFTEVGLGFYKVNLTSGDLNATTAALLFTANGVSGGASDPLPIGLVLQKVSGYQ